MVWHVNRAGVKRINGTFGPLLGIKSLIFRAIHAGLMGRIFRQHEDSMSAIKINFGRRERRHGPALARAVQLFLPVGLGLLSQRDGLTSR